jgi:uncharacterized lipoprotein YbaY
MRMLGFWLLAGLLAALGSARAQEAGSIPTSVLSRCAGKAGTDIRKGDPAFVTVAFDGRPWLAIERTEETVGTQKIATTVSGMGWLRRKDGTSVPLRFTCMLDPEGQAVMTHLGLLLRNLGDELPPSIVIDGAASYLEKMPLPHGVELQVELLDISKSAAGEVLAEQVVRSGWQVPIPFALRLPRGMSLEGRKMVITARFVQARQPLFQLRDQRPLDTSDFHKFIVLTLDKVGEAKP